MNVVAERSPRTPPGRLSHASLIGSASAALSRRSARPRQPPSLSSSPNHHLPSSEAALQLPLSTSMEARLLLKAVRLALGSGRPPPSSAGARALHTGHRPPTTFLGRLVQRVLPQSTHHAPVQVAQPFAYRGVHTQRQNLSLPARQFIQQNTARTMHSVPRPPTVSKGVQQVGLGKARSFSTASPLFHTGVKNVPIVARAFAQADLDIKGSMADSKLKARKGKKAKHARALHRLAADNLSISSASYTPAEMEHYFPDASPSVLTQVTISLEPACSGVSSPSSQSDSTSDSDSDSDFWQHLADVHALYRPHMRRVEAVIRRLEPYAHLRRNEDVIGWSSTFDDEFGLPTAVRFAFSATRDDVREWLGDFAGARWLTVEDVTPGPGVFASLNTQLDAVWNSGSIFPDPIAAPAARALSNSLTALPEWGALPATPPAQPLSGASTPPDGYADSELGGAWTSGFGTASEEWEYDAEEEDVLSEPVSVAGSMASWGNAPGWGLQFSAEWETRAGQAVTR
ncbi:hypothetical protein CALCODRAFT_175381 [Calocera cornea HHB12733]|uniref:Uncharacterized protein n=1 Tax=Calocera cornea HHB12733 TaxID=1353952 RepID=A0A165HU24_9BASI|nr:hypothetical protein CALCODRAFT_175381 [Calocera cornea HHB12733]